MATSPYDLYPPSSISIIQGFVFEGENSIEMGNSRLWGSLDITSLMYTLYSASVGLQSASSGTQLGACNDIAFERNRTIEVIEVGNVVDSGLYRITSEENNLTFTVMEWRPSTIALAFGSTYSVLPDGDNGIIVFGGGCTISSRPMVVRGANVSCAAPDITALTDGVKYIVLTLYDCYSAEGVTLNVSAREQEGLEITMRARPVLSLDAGSRIGNLVLAAA